MKQFSQHRWQILRANWSHANAFSNRNCDRYGDGNCNGYTHGYSELHAEADSHAEISTYAQASPDPGASPIALT